MMTVKPSFVGGFLKMCGETRIRTRRGKRKKNVLLKIFLAGIPVLVKLNAEKINGHHFVQKSPTVKFHFI